LADSQSKLQATAANAMSRAEIDDFLRSGRRNAILGTQRPDGHVQVTPVWYWWEDGLAHFELGEARQHLRNLRLVPRATLLVEEDLRLTRGWRAGAKGVMLAGPVEITGDPELHGRVSAKMAEHYLGDDKDDPDFLATIGDETFYLVTIRPEKVVSWDYTKAV
jgi:PPOX class probable F420-dependent enzyme